MNVPQPIKEQHHDYPYQRMAPENNREPEERDAVPGAVNEDAAMALAAMKLALASLEAEPVVFRSKLKPPSAIGSENWDYTIIASQMLSNLRAV
ncbi:hypothetical protein ACVXG7_19660 [Enterobacter hormaechei]